MELLKAQVQKTVSEAVNKAVEGMFSATQAANQIALVPQVAPPIVPEVPVVHLGAPGPAAQHQPADAAVGVNAGIETLVQGMPQ